MELYELKQDITTHLERLTALVSLFDLDDKQNK